MFSSTKFIKLYIFGMVGFMGEEIFLLVSFIYIIFLSFADSPVLTCDKQEYFTQHGQSISFTCDLKANPGASVSWKFSGTDGTQSVAEHPGETSIQTHDKVQHYSFGNSFFFIKLKFM